jgi:hypothetical protein
MRLAALLLLAFYSTNSLALSTENKKKSEVSSNRELSTAQYCRQYEGKLVAFYSDVWEVKGCKRIPLSSEEVYRRTNAGELVLDVEAAVVRGIKEGQRIQITKKRSCSELEGKYVSLDFEDIWFVTGCSRRKFPDWMSYSRQRGGLDKESAILELTWDEFKGLKEGKDYASVYDTEAEITSRDVDTIPIEEACRGIEGKYVYYYSRIYKIEKCARRPIDPEKFTRKYPDVAPKELSAEQWLSLPLGAPL